DREEREKRLERIKESLAKEKGKARPQWYVNGQGQSMVAIPGPVDFMMGAPLTEKDRNDDELQHQRRIGRSFAIAAKAVTGAEFRGSQLAGGEQEAERSRVVRHARECVVLMPGEVQG